MCTDVTARDAFYGASPPQMKLYRYAHPVETIFGNIFPALFGPLVMRASLCVWCFWLTLRMLKTCDAHSGAIAARLEYHLWSYC